MVKQKLTIAAERIRRIRRKRGETQAEFARHLDVDPVTVARWETGQRACTGAYARTVAQLDLEGLPLFETVNEEGQMRKAKTIAFFNHKGGVSKTTTTYNLGWMLARKGYRVLLVDGDPQCNLTGMTLALAGEDDFERLYEESPSSNLHAALRPAFESMPQQIKPVECFEVPQRAGLFLLPGHVSVSDYDVPLGVAHELSGSLTVMKNLPGAIGYLLQVTAEDLDVDFVLVDMSPSISALNHNFLISSDYFVVPSSPDYFCAQAIDSLSKVLPAWADWPRRAGNTFDGAAYAPPKSAPMFLGTINQRFRPRYGEPAKAFQKWIDRINERVKSRLAPALRKAGMMLSEKEYEAVRINSDPYSLANIADFNSLIAKSQEFAVPVFELTDQQLGVGGDVLRITRASRDSFLELFESLADSLVTLTGSPAPKKNAASGRGSRKP